MAVLLDGSTTTASSLAARAVALARTDTGQARTAALGALEAANGADPGVASVAHRVLGLVAREESDLPGSIGHFRRAIALADHAAAPSLAGEARIGLMAAYAILGNWNAAISEGEVAISQLQGSERARAQAQMGSVLRESGRLDEALELYRRALPGLRSDGDHLALARLYNNRAGVHFYRGSLAAALVDYEAADRLYRAAGCPRIAAKARENWGVVVARQGDLARALAAFAEADELRGGEPDLDPLSLRDRAMVLLGALLLTEARSYLRQAVDGLRAGGRVTYLAEAQVLLAEAALLDRDPAEAKAAAEDALAVFTSQRRGGWAALAANLAIRAAWAGGDRSPSLLPAARRTAVALRRAGFAVAAVDARLRAGQMALALGKPGIAERELEAARRARRHGPVDVRVRAWHAEALLRLQHGDRRGAWAALRAGIGALDRYRTSLAATDLRVHASGHGEDLAGLGIRLAMEDGDPRRVLAWTERCRAISQRPRQACPPTDPRVAGDLAELRQVVARTHEAALAGHPTSALLARQATLEERVRDRARHAPALDPCSVGSGSTGSELARALGERALIELVEHDRWIHAVVVTGRRARLVPLAETERVTAELEALRFSLRRLAFLKGSTASVDAAADAVRYGLARMDDLLIGPLSGAVEGRPVVVVPNAALHAAPWSVLPSLLGRAVCVAPSAAVWQAASCAAAEGTGGGRVALVAGPDLPFAAREVAALARRHPGAIRLTGRRATCDAVRRAVDGAALAHLAAHGDFRWDNPLFSYIRIADGPVTVYDLESLERPPGVLVLSACDSGVSDARPGDELMGLVASLLAIGTRTVVASVCPVPDDATRRLMLAFHGGMARGLGPAAALGAAQRRLFSGTPRELAAAAGFVCFGAG